MLILVSVINPRCKKVIVVTSCFVVQHEFLNMANFNKVDKIGQISFFNTGNWHKNIFNGKKVLFVSANYPVAVLL